MSNPASRHFWTQWRIVTLNTHNLICDFGKHDGTPWTRVPVSYLKWMLNQPTMDANKKAIADSELKRRGTVTPELDISGHAIDRASQHCLDLWEDDRQGDEGLHAWLVRKATKALRGKPDAKGRHAVDGMLFAFEEGSEWPVLKTVMRDHRAERYAGYDLTDADIY